MGRVQIAAVTAQRQLHEDAVIHPGAEHQRQRHKIEQVPRPAAQTHYREQTKPAQEQHQQTQRHFFHPPERQPEGEQHKRNHRTKHAPQVALHLLQYRGAKQFPSG